MASERSKDTVKRAKKRATCLVTLLQNELKSDVARFTTHVQTCLATNQVSFKRGKTGNIAKLSNSFCSKVAKQVARFLLPALPYLKKDWLTYAQASEQTIEYRKGKTTKKD